MLTLNKHAKVSTVTFSPELALGRLVCHVCMTRHAVLFCLCKILLSFCQSRYNSVMTWPILTKLGGKDHWPCPNMSYDFDLRMTFDLDIGVKNVIFIKAYSSDKLHVMITCLGHVTWLWSVHLGCARLRGQRSLRGHFRSKVQKY